VRLLFALIEKKSKEIFSVVLNCINALMDCGMKFFQNNIIKMENVTVMTHPEVYTHKREHFFVLSFEDNFSFRSDNIIYVRQY
jgi:hypothetical protein